MNPLEIFSEKSTLECIYYIKPTTHGTFENAFHVAGLVCDTEGKGLEYLVLPPVLPFG